MMAQIRYTESVEGVTADMLHGFFEGWRVPPSPQVHLQMLRGSNHVVMAMDDCDIRVVGRVNAISDGCHAAFIPMLEVLPVYRGRGIGTALMRSILETFHKYACVDLTCDPPIQPFYERLRMQRSVGMVIHNLDWHPRINPRINPRTNPRKEG